MGLAHVASVLSRSWRVRCLAELGEFDEARRVGHEAVRIADTTGHAVSQVAARTAVGIAELRKGELSAAILPLEEAVDLELRYHRTSWLLEVQAVLGYAYVLTGRPAEGVPLLERARGRHPHGRALGGAWLAEAHLLAGRVDEAARQAEQALGLARQQQARGQEAWVLRIAGEIAAGPDGVAVEVAERAYRESMSLARELAMRPLIAHCHVGLGRLYRRAGRPEAARAELEAGLALLRSMGMTFWAGPAEAELRALRGI
jgi:tetratricopeptide (TPR) repeat protein